MRLWGWLLQLPRSVEAVEDASRIGTTFWQLIGDGTGPASGAANVIRRWPLSSPASPGTETYIAKMIITGDLFGRFGRWAFFFFDQWCDCCDCNFLRFSITRMIMKCELRCVKLRAKAYFMSQGWCINVYAGNSLYEKKLNVQNFFKGKNFD